MVDRAFQKDGRFSPWAGDPRFQPDASAAPLVVGPSRMIGVRVMAASSLSGGGIEAASLLDGGRVRAASSGAGFTAFPSTDLDGVKVISASTLSGPDVLAGE